MPKKIDYIIKEELKRKFIDLKTYKEVADYFGCSQQTIRNKVKEYGLVTKSRHKRISGLGDVIKDKIIDCLSIYGCALSSQILEYIGLDDARYASNPLKELLREKKISKTLYRGFEFYILPGNESEVKRKIRVSKFYIEETIKNHGPLRSKPLVQLIKEEFDYVVSHLMVYRLAKELVSEEKLGVFKVSLNSIYFIKEDRNQELKAKQIVKNFYNKRRNFKLENVKEIFYLELDKEFVFKEIEKAEWMVISKKIAPFLKIECTGRSYLDLIRTIYFMLIKREIYLRNLKRTNIKDLIPLLRLYDIIEKKNGEYFQGFSNRTYKHFIKEILNHREFCEKNLRSQILNTPDIYLKIQYILSTLFGFDKNNTNKIYILFKNTLKKGYSISGKSVKGILGGLIYYFSQNFSLGLTQGYIANKLDITEVTLRARYKEIKELAPYFDKLNIEKHELKVKESDEKEIQSHSKIKSQKEVVNKKKMENEVDVIYIEDDEEIGKKASEVAYEIKIQLLFELNENGCYQSSCGRTYRYKSYLLNHYLNCPECSNTLLKKEENGFFRCICKRTYRYAYQFSNHIKKCRDFENYLKSLLNQDKVVKHRNDVNKQNENRRFRGNLSDFENFWATIKNILPPGSVIFTLKENKPNEIVKVGDIGITVRTEGSPTIITKDLIKKAWHNLVNDGILYQKDHEKSTYRSSFILTLFSQLDFVKIIREGPLCVRLDSAELKNYEEADECHDKALEIDPKDKEAWFNKGLVLGNLNKYEEAIESLNRVLEIDPEYLDAWFYKGLALSTLKKYKEATKCYDKVLEIDPKEKDAWFIKAVVLNELKKYEEAIECYDKVLEIDPKDKNGWYLKGLALETLERYQQAIKCYEEALEIDPRYKKAWFNKEKCLWFSRGLNFFNMEKYEKAIECYDRTLEIDPEYDDAWYYKGLANFEKDEYDKAIECYDKIEPSNADTLYQKGRAFFKKQEYDKAWLFTGLSYDEQEKYEKAIEYYDKALEINPEYDLALYNKGTLYFRKRNYDKAIEYFNKSLEINPKEFFAWFLKGKAYSEKLEHDKEIECYDKALEIDPGYKDVLYSKELALDNLKKEKNKNSRNKY